MQFLFFLTTGKTKINSFQKGRALSTKFWKKNWKNFLNKYLQIYISEKAIYAAIEENKYIGNFHGSLIIRCFRHLTCILSADILF